MTFWPAEANRDDEHDWAFEHCAVSFFQRRIANQRSPWTKTTVVVCHGDARRTISALDWERFLAASRGWLSGHCELNEVHSILSLLENSVCIVDHLFGGGGGGGRTGVGYRCPDPRDGGFSLMS